MRLRLAGCNRYQVWFAPILAFGWVAGAFTRSVWDGVYTKEQAHRGQTVYGQECAKCHGENLAVAKPLRH